MNKIKITSLGNYFRTEYGDISAKVNLLKTTFHKVEGTGITMSIDGLVITVILKNCKIARSNHSRLAGRLGQIFVMVDQFVPQEKPPLGFGAAPLFGLQNRR